MSTPLPKISTLGERMDLELHQGATMRPVRHQLLNPDETPVDLTGSQVRGQIRDKALATGVLAEFQTRLAPDPTLGWYEIWLTDEQTAALPAGDKLTDPASAHEYDVEVEDAAGDVRVTFYGTVLVKAGVTRTP